MRQNSIFASYLVSGFFVFLLNPVSAFAEVQTLKSVAQKAVLTNPEVLERWHAYKAADEERDAAFGNYLPKLDLNAGVGREHRDDPQVKADYTRRSHSLILTQMLYDGFLTRNEVKRFDHASLVRVFELHAASENAALEAARAYLDVLRYRKLAGLAEDNYVRHRSVLDQIQRRVQAGVGRRVDLEQASGRMALAESNLLTETSNLHDVSARFLRVVGVVPAKEMEEFSLLNKNMPKDSVAAMTAAQRSNPALQAAIENVRASYYALRGRDAAYQPRVDLRLRRDSGRDLNGYVGHHETNAAEVLLSWNLFNGFSDRARSKQYGEQRNVAKDIRDKTCRDTRQTVTIAFNDTLKLNEQLKYLDQHQLSIEKARDAYRKQFDIGQRTLLDLLDTENEMFQAKRAYINAEHDLALAYVRTHAGTGNLLFTLGLSKAGDDTQPVTNVWAADEDAAENCPPDAPVLYTVDKPALDARAQELLKDSAPIAPEGKAQDATPPLMDAERGAAEALKTWVSAWSGRNQQAYFDSYAPNFAPEDGLKREEWVAKRKNALSKAQNIVLEVSDIKLTTKDARHITTTFKQTYRSANYQDVVRKTLELELIEGRWLIVREVSEPFGKK